MIIGGVGLPVRFAGSKKRAEGDKKRQTLVSGHTDGRNRGSAEELVLSMKQITSFLTAVFTYAKQHLL